MLFLPFELLFVMITVYQIDLLCLIVVLGHAVITPIHIYRYVNLILKQIKKNHFYVNER